MDAMYFLKFIFYDTPSPKKVVFFLTILLLSNEFEFIYIFQVRSMRF